MPYATGLAQPMLLSTDTYERVLPGWKLSESWDHVIHSLVRSFICSGIIMELTLLAGPRLTARICTGSEA